MLPIKQQRFGKWESGGGRREEEESAALQESSSGDVLDEEQLRINQ